MQPTLRQPPDAYDAIADAIGSTEAGRLFLAEHARRSRAADTERLLAAVAALERALPPARSADRNTVPAADAAEALAAIGRQLGGAAAPPSGVLGAFDDALRSVLAVADGLQDQAWVWRERGLDPALCDGIDGAATELYRGCGLQETGTRRLQEVGLALAGVAEALRSARG